MQYVHSSCPPWYRNWSTSEIQWTGAEIPSHGQPWLLVLISNTGKLASFTVSWTRSIQKIPASQLSQLQNLRSTFTDAAKPLSTWGHAFAFCLHLDESFRPTLRSQSTHKPGVHTVTYLQNQWMVEAGTSGDAKTQPQPAQRGSYSRLLVNFPVRFWASLETEPPQIPWGICTSIWSSLWQKIILFSMFRG